MGKALEARPPCAVSVDLDGEWISSISLGQDAGPADGHFRALPRFLDMLGRFKLRATFFVVGKDLSDPLKRGLIRRVRDAGHEVGNHSLSHPSLFSRLSPREKRKEIFESHRLIADAAGDEPKGFRAPAYDVDAETLGILQELGYHYDSSVLPSPAVIGRRLMAAWSYGWRAPGSRIGRLSHLLAPRHPYRPSPDGLWRRGDAPIVEVPIGVSPFSRLPLSSTLHLTTRGKLLPLAFSEMRWKPEAIHWTFHLRDLVDSCLDGTGFAVSRLPVIRMPLDQKFPLMERIFKGIADSHDPMTISAYIRTLSAAGRLA